MLEGFVGALELLLNPSFEIWVFAGVIIGLIVGVLPGISGLSAIAIFLPFAFVLKPEQALPFMIAVCATTFTGGVITAILIGIPGDAPNAASCLDGFPMTQKGQGGRALGAALISSGAGGLVAGLVALATIPLVILVVYQVASADMVFIILLGILCVGGLATGEVSKGIISGMMGLLVSLVGSQASTGVPRFTFDSLYLYNGIKLMPLALGLFAMPVMIDLIITGTSISSVPVKVTGMREVWQGGKDVIRNWVTFLRCIVIGYIVGIIPGIGATATSFIAYAQARRSSKHRDEFGSGNVEGLIAATCGTNSSLGGDLLTTLAFGIPGSSTMAILLGGMLIVNLTPGPSMLTEHLSLSLGLMYTIILANFIGTIICLFCIPQLVKVAIIPNKIIVALMVPIIFIGAYTSGENFNDLTVMLIAAAIGVLMRRFGYNLPALFLGYVLGDLFETYFFKAYGVGGPTFFVRPISLIVLALCVLVLTYGPLSRAIKRAIKKPQPTPAR